MAIKRKSQFKRVILDGYSESADDPAWIEIDQDPPMGRIMDAESEESEPDKGIAILQAVIHNWNLKNEDGSVADITKENIRSLGVSVLIELYKYTKNIGSVGANLQEAGKKGASGQNSEESSLDTSTPEESNDQPVSPENPPMPQ